MRFPAAADYTTAHSLLQLVRTDCLVVAAVYGCVVDRMTLTTRAFSPEVSDEPYSQ